MLRSPTLPPVRAASLVLLALGIGAAPAHCGGSLLYSIPPGWAPKALNEWSRQAGVQILFDYNILRHYRTRGIAAAFQPLDALGALLRDTPLTFDVVNDATVNVVIGSQYCQPWLAERSPLPPCVQMPARLRAAVL